MARSARSNEAKRRALFSRSTRSASTAGSTSAMGALLVGRQAAEGGEDHVSVLLPGLLRSRTERRDRLHPALLRRDQGGEQADSDAAAGPAGPAGPLFAPRDPVARPPGAAGSRRRGGPAPADASARRAAPPGPPAPRPGRRRSGTGFPDTPAPAGHAERGGGAPGKRARWRGSPCSSSSSTRSAPTSSEGGSETPSATARRRSPAVLQSVRQLDLQSLLQTESLELQRRIVPSHPVQGPD